MDSSSSDSDVGEKIKNIQSVLVKSESSHQEGDQKYAYKRKLGDLIFNAHFEAGNLGQVEQVNQYEYDLMVRPDVANPRFRTWFNFTVSNQLPNQCVIFTFVNFSDKTKLFDNGLTPVVRSKSQPDWIRLHEDQVFFYRSDNHGDRYVLSLAFRFSTYEDEHQFATFYPGTYSNLVSFLNRWSVELKRSRSKQPTLTKQSQARLINEEASLNRSFGHHNDKLRIHTSLGFRETRADDVKIGEDVSFEVRSMGASILSKNIYGLSIKGTSSWNKPTVLVLCRSCGNVDAVSSLVCQGLLDYLLCDNLVARASRQFIDFECFPMMDPDSCWVGNSQTDLMGQTSISAQLMRTNKNFYANLMTINNTIDSICAQRDRVILLELKVNLNLIGSRMVCTRYKDSLRMERHLSLVRLIARFADDFYLENCMFLSKFDSFVGPFDFRSRLNLDQYRLEVSPFAFYKRSLTECKLKEYNQKQYLSLGKAVVYSLLELLRPKDQSIPYGVATILNSFQPRANDIDDLLLRLKNTC